MLQSIFGICAGLLLSISAQAIPVLREMPQNFSPMFTTDFDFEGIVALSSCSGSLVQLETSRGSDPALVLTNGHCVEHGMPRPGQSYVNKPSRRTFRVMSPSGRSVGVLNATQLIYATMTKTDFGLYRVKETYEEIYRRFNVRPLTLASTAPRVGDPIEVVSGYWERGFRCSVEAIVHKLLEGGYLMEDSIRYTRPGCEVYGGTSGSPVIHAGRRIVVGVNNTGNESGRMCDMNNPCEIDQNGNRSATKGFSYGQQTHWVYACLNGNLDLDLNQAGCKLPQ